MSRAAGVPRQLSALARRRSASRRRQSCCEPARPTATDGRRSALRLVLVRQGREPAQPVGARRLRVQPQAARPGGPRRAVPQAQAAGSLAARAGRRSEAAPLVARRACARRRSIAGCVGPHVNRRFLERSLYDRPQDRAARRPATSPPSPTICAHGRRGRCTATAWSGSASPRIEPVDDYDGQVYDFTVNHPDHNFVANGFVVSNCGVRLVRSNLFYREVKPHLRKLVDELFRNVPDRRRHVRAATRSTRRSCDHLLGEGPRYLRRPRPGDAGRHRPHRGRRPARRRRPGRGQRPRPQPRRRAVRHARLGQPLPRSAGRRSRLRRGGRRASWAWKRTWSAS